jgi:hypothetical protein
MEHWDGWRAAPVENPVFRGSSLFFSFEDLRSARLARIRSRHALDDVMSGETDELRRIFLLRQWLFRRVVVDPSRPAAWADGDTMLEAAPRGGAYHCGHFMVMQHAIMNACGYVTRCLGAGPGGRENTYEAAGHHGANEIWCNTIAKWVLSDAEGDCHFEKAGMPLSALEVRDELLRNGAAEVIRVGGPERTPTAPELLLSPHAYRWIAWDLQGDRETSYPFLSRALVVYEDEYFRANTWYRYGKEQMAPHWGYGADCFVRVRHREWIEWTPNVLDVKTEIRGDCADVSLHSCTPNFQTYEMRARPGGWKRIGDRVTISLSGRRRDVEFRAVNLADVAGPAHRVLFER